MPRTQTKASNTVASERRFYARSKAFGRFGMRIFKPQIMEHPHHHGHVEANFTRGCRLHYKIDGADIAVEPGQLVIFWANVSHQLVSVEALGEPELCNIYIPLDMFLMMPHLAELQMVLLNGAMIVCPSELCGHDMLTRWHADYRAANTERLDILKMELNALFRRMEAQGLQMIKQPWADKKAPHSSVTASGEQDESNRRSSAHIRHVVAMVRYVFDNLEQPMKNEDVTDITGLHPNYALNIFSKTMNIPLKQFILRMRLLRARGLLLESDVAISKVATESGFGSTSQFYAHFAAAYGMPPNQLRIKYIGM
jgi:AraC-like DNA-binding protein